MWIFEKGKTLREANPGIDSINDFAIMSDKNLLYIYFVYDWSSPLYRMGLKDKKVAAWREAGDNFEGERPSRHARAIMKMEVANVNRAISKFVSIQRLSDQDQAVVEALQYQIEEITRNMATPSKDVAELQKKVSISKILLDLIKQRKQIAKALDLRSGDEEVDAEKEIEREMSALDQFNEEKQNED